jgi:hypothetical protein
MNKMVGVLTSAALILGSAHFAMAADEAKNEERLASSAEVLR